MVVEVWVVHGVEVEVVHDAEVVVGAVQMGDDGLDDGLRH